MRQQRSGRIVNTASAAGLGNMGQANYSAAKEGIVGFTRTVARDMGRYGVTCNVIRPGAATRLTMTPELMAAWEKRKQTLGDSGLPGGGGDIPDLEAMTPEAISPMVVYLCTDEAASINGCTFDLQGGNIGLYSEPTVIKSIHKDGIWTLDELSSLIPKTLAAGLVNPSPPKQ